MNAQLSLFDIYDTKPEGRADLYQLTTDSIIASLESGVIPWRRPWRDLGGRHTAPMNRVSKKPYRGINVFMLDAIAMSCGYSSNEWVTFKQALELGGKIRKGEKSSRVVFWKWIEKVGKTGKIERIAFLNQYCVFNLDQCDGIDPLRPAIDPADLPEHPETEACVEASKLISAYFARPGAPKFVEGRNCNQASYAPFLDKVSMPDRRAFNGLEEFFSTLSHEVAHSTGHESRLKRDLTGVISKTQYGKEELIAEMTAAFFCRHVGINQTTEANSAAYLDGWLRTLKAPGNKQMLLNAAGSAQKAFELILGDMEGAENQ